MSLLRTLFDIISPTKYVQTTRITKGEEHTKQPPAKKLILGTKYQPEVTCTELNIDKHIEEQYLITLSQMKILDSSKLKEFTDDNFIFVENGRKLSTQVEITVGKGEIARYEQFLLFPQCFQKTHTAETEKWINLLNGVLRRF